MPGPLSRSAARRGELSMTTPGPLRRVALLVAIVPGLSCAPRAGPSGDAVDLDVLAADFHLEDSGLVQFSFTTMITAEGERYVPLCSGELSSSVEVEVRPGTWEPAVPDVCPIASTGWRRVGPEASTDTSAVTGPVSDRGERGAWNPAWAERRIRLTTFALPMDPESEHFRGASYGDFRIVSQGFFIDGRRHGAAAR